MRSILVTGLFLIFFSSQAQIKVTLNDKGTKQQISRFIYGQFAEHLGACVYNGFWVDSSLNVPKKGRIRMDVVEALRKIHVPVLRWPGGCFADQYHWRDGIGAKRPATINNPWGKIVEDNSFGTDEFLELCSLIGCEPYMAGNVGSGTPQEMADWIEYLNYDKVTDITKLRNGKKPYKVSFWGIGNESWGCGGNMTPEYFVDNYKRYAVFCNDYTTPLKKVASGNNVEWTEVFMKKLPLWMMWGMSIHYYAIPGDWTVKGPDMDFGEDQYFRGIKSAQGIDAFISKHSAIMDKYDTAKTVGLVVDEWGIWTDVSKGTNPDFLYQQNSMRDALIAGLTLNIFNQHSDRVRMANLAQAVNVLQALVLTDKEKMLLTPTYYVFDLYKGHQDATLIPLSYTSPDYVYGKDSIPAVNVSASKDSTGKILITMVNLDAVKTNKLLIPLTSKKINAQILHAASFASINTFEHPFTVKPTTFTQYINKNGQLEITLPPASLVAVTLN